MKTIEKYLSFVKFAHTLFALPFAIIGFVLAIKTTGISPVQIWKLLGLVLLCMVFARNAAMGFNRYTDRNIDAKNPRTAPREVPSGKISPAKALWFVIINATLFIISTFFINPMVFALSPVALLVVLGYSFTKHFTALCHFILGTGLSLAPIGAYLAVTGTFAVLPVIFSFIVLFWVSGFDIIYALQDEDFDKKYELNSMPVLLGKKKALLLSIVLHLICSVLTVFAGISGDFNILFAIGAAVFILLLIYQHLIISPEDISRVNIAFFTTNGIASLVFAVFVVLDIMLIN